MKSLLPNARKETGEPMSKPKMIGWIKDAKYPDQSLGVSVVVSTSQEHIIDYAQRFVAEQCWTERCIPPYTLTVTTYGRQKTLLKKVLTQEIQREERTND